MASIARKSDGRRIFTDAFKRKEMGRVLRGELTLSELSRRLGIARSLLHRWKRQMPQDNDLSSLAGRRATPASGLRTDRYIRELQLLVGKQTVELELLRAERDALKRERRSRSVSKR